MANKINEILFLSNAVCGDWRRFQIIVLLKFYGSQKYKPNGGDDLSRGR